MLLPYHVSHGGIALVIARFSFSCAVASENETKWKKKGGRVALF